MRPSRRGPRITQIWNKGSVNEIVSNFGEVYVRLKSLAAILGHDRIVVHPRDLNPIFCLSLSVSTGSKGPGRNGA